MRTVLSASRLEYSCTSPEAETLGIDRFEPVTALAATRHTLTQPPEVLVVHVRLA